jgi:hypothetical protein
MKNHATQSKINRKGKGPERYTDAARKMQSTTITLPAKLREDLEERAAETQRSLSGYVRYLVAKDLKDLTEGTAVK